MHTVQSQLEASLEPLGLSLAKLGVLAKLVDAGEPISLGTLADRMACVRSKNRPSSSIVTCQPFP